VAEHAGGTGSTVRAAYARAGVDVAAVDPVEAEYVPPVLAEKLFWAVPSHELPALPFDAFVTGIVEITERHYFKRTGKDWDSRNHEKPE
jgi:hypothetical protein